MNITNIKMNEESSKDPAGYLILTRRKGQRIMVGKDAEVVVTYLGRGFHKDEIRIAIQAPRDVPVWREEVYDNIKAEEENVHHRPYNSNNDADRS